MKYDRDRLDRAMGVGLLIVVASMAVWAITIVVRHWS